MTLYPAVGALWLAGIVKTALVNSVIKLFKEGFIPTVNTTDADLDDEECDYTGYAAMTITAWQAPLLNPLGGASIDSGLKQFAAAAPYTVGNSVGGYWLEAAAGDVVMASTLSTPRSVAAAGQGVGIDITLIFG